MSSESSLGRRRLLSISRRKVASASSTAGPKRRRRYSRGIRLFSQSGVLSSLKGPGERGGT
jgi:hypothetical protein